MLIVRARQGHARFGESLVERCFVEVRRRTRPMVCFVNVGSVDRIIYAIFNGLNEKYQWKNRALRLFTQAA
jgi:transposase-like protein